MAYKFTEIFILSKNMSWISPDFENETNILFPFKWLGNKLQNNMSKK